MVLKGRFSMLTISLVIIEVLMVMIAVSMIANSSLASSSLTNYSLAGHIVTTAYSSSSSNRNRATGYYLKLAASFHSIHSSVYLLLGTISRKLKNGSLRLLRFNLKIIGRAQKMTLAILSSASNLYSTYRCKLGRKNRIRRMFIPTEKYSLNFQNVLAR